VSTISAATDDPAPARDVRPIRPSKNLTTIPPTIVVRRGAIQTVRISMIGVPVFESVLRSAYRGDLRLRNRSRNVLNDSKPRSVAEDDQQPRTADFLRRSSPTPPATNPRIPLYHYTGQNGLIGIISARSLRATNIIYLNDATEFESPLKMIQEQLSEQQKNCQPESNRHRNATLFKTLINAYFGATYKEVLHEIYVACFCAKDDLLSQWLGYAGNDYGYCIALRVPKLQNTIRASGIIRLTYQGARCRNASHCECDN